jgi:hypothetical protein
VRSLASTARLVRSAHAEVDVAAHIEHILVELVAPTRTLAAVRAERVVLCEPRVPGLARGEAQ